MPSRFILLLVLVSGCRAEPGPSPEWQDGPGFRWQPLAPEGAGPGFTQLPASATGIDFANFLSDSAALANQVLAQGGGVALADVDGDGRTDIYFARTEGKSALYRNLGDWRFENIAELAGIALGDRTPTGVAFADIDGDRDPDLLVNSLGGPNALFRNDGTGHFANDPSYPGRGSRAGTTTSTLADIDGDGDLDLYQANDKAYNAKDRFTPQEIAFDQAVRRTGERSFEVVERLRNDYRVEVRDDLSSVVLLQKADPDSLYLNDGAGRFTAVATAGTERFVDENGRPFSEAPDNFTLVARFYDVDGDGDPDLYVANDFEDPDQLWLNDGRGYFRLAPKLSQRATSNAAMAIDMGDINRDGRVDIVTVDMLSRDSKRLKSQIPTHTPLPKRPGIIDDRPQLQRNTLFLNRGDGTFAQIAEFAGVEASGWSWSTLFLDVDLDGYEDLLVGTGNLWDFMDADTQEKYRNRLSDLNWRQQRMALPRLAVPNYAFRNRGDLTFEDVSQAWRFAADPDVSHGMATGDLDGDGDQDVAINRLGAPALVLRNDSPAARIAVSLKGKAPNTAGIGAKVRVLGGPVPSQEREVTAGGLYLSHAEPILTFAAGQADSLSIEVRWRDGTRSTIAGARPNRHYQIDQAAATSAPADAPPPPPNPLFADAASALSHRHHERPFQDAGRQPLLPNSFAELGPGLSWIDIDHDGDDDLFVGTGAGGTLGGFRNVGGRFEDMGLNFPPSAVDQTMILPVPDGRGGTRVLVAQSSYEADSLAQSLAIPSVIAIGFDRAGRQTGPPEAAIPGDTATVGPLALADYDGDGDLDLFAGGRILPGAYPLSPSSRFFLNDGTGRFSVDPVNTPVVRGTGMVSSAVFADFDGDGDPDLAYTTEWGPVKLLINDRGRLTPAPNSLGLGQLFGRWWGLATGDFDEDGRPDLVATGWGRNLSPRADSATPLLVYFGNFDDNGSLDLILAQHDRRLNATAPLTSFARLTRAIPTIAERIRTFGAYADATIDQVLGPAATEALKLGINTTESVVWFNRGDRFEPRALPLDAQLAPAIGPVVADFDGDGHEDLALTQNFFPTEINSPRLDAGRGLLLFGDGRGGFTARDGAVSGLLVYGDQRGGAAADVDGDGRVDLVIAQNGADTRLAKNRGAAPGIRVTLQGPATNPTGIGARIRLTVGGRATAWREIQSGSGYWSATSPAAVLGRPGPGAGALEVRWPSGRVTTFPVSATSTRMTVRPDPD